MIQDIMQWFRSELAIENRKNRGWFDANLGHDVRLREALILKILIPDLANAYTSYNEEAYDANNKIYAEIYKNKGLDEFGMPANPSYHPYLLGRLTGRDLEDAMWADAKFMTTVKEMLQRKMLSVEYMKKFMNAASKTDHKAMTNLDPNYIKKQTAMGMIFKLQKGYFSKKAILPSGLKGYQGWVNKAMIGAYQDTFASVRDKIGDEFGAGAYHYMGNYERNPTTGRKKKGSRQKTVAKAKTGTAVKSLTRAHQKTTQAGGVGILKPKGAQKTVARLTLARSAKAMAQKAMAISKNGKKVFLTGGGYDELRTEMFGGLEESYDLKELRNINTNEFDITQILNIEITDRAGNAGLIDIYDRSGIHQVAESAMRLKANRIAVKYGKNAAEMEGSPKTKDIYRDIHAGILIAQLLGMKHKTNPNMKLKINKQLLKAAKKAQVRKRRKIGTWAESLKTEKLKKVKRSGAVNVSAGSGKNIKKNKRPGGQAPESRTGTSPIALRNILNEALPMMIASKMNEPALRYRTGRFANSAQVRTV